MPYEAIDNPLNLQKNVKADYSNGVVINSLSDLTSTDPTGSRSGNVSAEGRAADGIVQLSTSYAQDVGIAGYAGRTARANTAYNAASFNCSTFAKNALKTAYPALDASQQVNVSLPMRAIGLKNATVTAPNNLYNATMGLPGAQNIRGPKSVIAKPYLQLWQIE